MHSVVGLLWFAYQPISCGRSGSWNVVESSYWKSRKSFKRCSEHSEEASRKSNSSAVALHSRRGGAVGFFAPGRAVLRSKGCNFDPQNTVAKLKTQESLGKQIASSPKRMLLDCFQPFGQFGGCFDLIFGCDLLS